MTLSAGILERSAASGLALLAVMALAITAATAQPAPPTSVTLPYHSADKSVGVVNCANSLCHGSVEPIKDSNVLQTEYVTWSRVDKHARSYRALFNDQSLRIARNLGL